MSQEQLQAHHAGEPAIAFPHPEKKILMVAAMDTECKDIIDQFSMTETGRLLGHYPYYTSTHTREIVLLQTYVGMIDAPAAIALALDKIEPDVVLKVGCVGGSSPEVQENDIMLPLSFSNMGAWVTRSAQTDRPTADATKWYSLYGDKDFQNNDANLGRLGLDKDNYQIFPDEALNASCEQLIKEKKLPLIKSHLGSGDIVIFHHKMLENVRKNILKDEESPLCSDNESYAIAKMCKIKEKPFTGVYFVASSDFNAPGGYNSQTIREQTRQTILPIIEEVIYKI
jgi:nucleoside phosphorylase